MGEGGGGSSVVEHAGARPLPQLQGVPCTGMGQLLTNTFKEEKQMSGSGKSPNLSEPPFPCLSKGMIIFASVGIMSMSEHLAWCPARSLRPLNGNYDLYLHLLRGVSCA